MADPNSSLVRSIIPEIVDPLLRKSERTKFAIVQATIEVYAAHGREGTTYERIAKSAGISRPLVQKYFPDREELFDLAMKFIRGNLQGIALKALGETHGSPEGELEAYVRSVFGWFVSHPSHARTMLGVICHAAHSRVHRASNTELADMGHERIATLLARLPANKGAKAKDLQERAKVIQNIIVGSFVCVLTEDLSLPFARLEERTVETCLAVARVR
jgi:AcrR family transcriptional regulator